jgi:cell division protein FtsI/penicillin-binding protein 2
MSTTVFRIRLILKILPLLAVFILVRLFYWQIIRGDYLRARATDQHTQETLLAGQRGDILDINGNILAGTKKLFELAIYKPTTNQDLNDIPDLLIPIILSKEEQSSPAAILETKKYLTDRINLNSNWVSLKHYLSYEQKTQIENLNIKGLEFGDEYIRFYPEASISAHLLGFVGKNEAGISQGYFGLEGFFDRQLQGREGLIRLQKDVLGNPILIGKYKKIDANTGRSLVTSIDKNLQYLTENLLQDGLFKYQATAGAVIVMESKTGKIRAMASLPSYSPGDFSKSDQSLFKNPNVANLFEPGSTFKTLIMAAALNEGVIEPDTQCDICQGPVSIGKYLIKTWDEKYYPNSTMEDVLVHSDNTGMVFVGNNLGSEKMAEYLERFGLNKKTGIEAQEEVSSLSPQASKIKEIDLATISFGQGIAVTPIGLITAVNSIANNGYLIKPTLIDHFINERGDVIPTQTPDKTQVLSEDSVRKITQMMIKAVAKGEVKWSVPKGIITAGKTGTAQIPIEGHYDEDKTIASFIGFFPADNPRYTMLVTLKEPQTSPWGSETAAPLWFKIANQILLLQT